MKPSSTKRLWGNNNSVEKKTKTDREGQSELKGQAFNTKLRFKNCICDHGDGIGSDMEKIYVEKFGANFFKENRESFRNGMVIESYSVVAKQLAQYYLNENSNINYDAYEQIVEKIYEHTSTTDNYDLFEAAAYQTLYQHVTKYFGLDDLFAQHRTDVTGKLQYSNPMQLDPDSYNAAYYGIYESWDEEKKNGYYTVNHLIEKFCDQFEMEFNKIILPVVKVVTTFYMLSYYGELHMRNTTYFLVDNLKRAGCGYIDHNEAYYHAYNKRVNIVLYADYGYNSEQYRPIVFIKDHQKRPFELLTNCLCDRYEKTMQYLEYRHNIVNTPDQSVVVHNTTYISYVDSECVEGLSFLCNNKFVYIADKSPDLFYVKSDSIKTILQGSHALIWDGKEACVIGLFNDEIYDYKQNTIMIKQKKNYIIWVQSIVPNWKISDEKKKNRIVVPIDNQIKELEPFQLERIQNKMVNMSFNELETISFLWLVGHHFNSGACGFGKSF